MTTNALAERLGVTAASASGMVKKLDGLGLVSHVPYKGVELTDDGERVALEVIRHHRLLELYLAESLDVPWDRVHAEAEVLEHVLSEELEELIAAKLGNPTVDPHGDPIPTRGPRDRGAPDAARWPTSSAGGARRLRAHLGLRPGDAALPGRARHRARRRLRGHRQAAVRRADLRALRRRRPRARAARWPGRCASRWRHEPTTPSPSAVAEPGEPSDAHAERAAAAASRGRCAARSPCSARPSSPCIAYVDPGNFATNIAGGAKYGYLLLWVLLSRQPHGDADPEPVGQDRHRHRAQPARAVPRALPAAGHLGAVGPGRAHRHGHRPGRVRRRRHRAEPALRRAALRRRASSPRSSPSGSSACRRRATGASRPSSPGCSGVIILGFLYDTLRIGFDAGAAARGFIPGFAGTD